MIRKVICKWSADDLTCIYFLWLMWLHFPVIYQSGSGKMMGHVIVG